MYYTIQSTELGKQGLLTLQNVHCTLPGYLDIGRINKLGKGGAFSGHTGSYDLKESSTRRMMRLLHYAETLECDDAGRVRRWHPRLLR